MSISLKNSRIGVVVSKSGAGRNGRRLIDTNRSLVDGIEPKARDVDYHKKFVKNMFSLRESSSV